MLNNYERRVLEDTIRNIDYMMTFFFHDKEVHANAISTLKNARDIIATQLTKAGD